MQCYEVSWLDCRKEVFNAVIFHVKFNLNSISTYLISMFWSTAKGMRLFYDVLNDLIVILTPAYPNTCWTHWLVELVYVYSSFFFFQTITVFLITAYIC